QCLLGVRVDERQDLFGDLPAVGGGVPQDVPQQVEVGVVDLGAAGQVGAGLQQPDRLPPAAVRAGQPAAAQRGAELGHHVEDPVRHGYGRDLVADRVGQRVQADGG